MCRCRSDAGAPILSTNLAAFCACGASLRSTSELMSCYYYRYHHWHNSSRTIRCTATCRHSRDCHLLSTLQDNEMLQDTPHTPCEQQAASYLPLPRHCRRKSSRIPRSSASSYGTSRRSHIGTLYPLSSLASSTTCGSPANTEQLAGQGRAGTQVRTYSRSAACRALTAKCTSGGGWPRKWPHNCLRR